MNESQDYSLRTEKNVRQVWHPSRVRVFFFQSPEVSMRRPPANFWKPFGLATSADQALSGTAYFNRSKDFWSISWSFKPLTFSIALVLIAISLVFLVGLLTL